VFAIFVLLSSAIAIAYFQSSDQRSVSATQQLVAANVTRATASMIERELNRTLATALTAAMYDVGRAGGEREDVERLTCEYLNRRISEGWSYPNLRVSVPRVSENDLMFEWQPDGSVKVRAYLENAEVTHVYGPTAHGIKLGVSLNPRFERLRSVAQQVSTEAASAENLEALERELNSQYAAEGLEVELREDNDSVIAIVRDAFAAPSAVVGQKMELIPYIASVGRVGPGVLEGMVFDSETGEGVGGARILGEAHSETIPIDIAADENGYFRISLPRGDHTYAFNVSAIGYDPKAMEGSVRAGERKYLRIPLDYNPFDLGLAENSGALERDWLPYALTSTYEYRMGTSFSAYKLNVRKLGGHVYNTGEITSNQYYRERVWVPPRVFNSTGAFLGHDYLTGREVNSSDYIGKEFIAGDSNELNLHKLTGCPTPLRNVRYKARVITVDGHYELRYAGYRTWGGWAILALPDPHWMHFQGTSSYGWGVTIPRQDFAITYSDYLNLRLADYYRNNGSFIRTDNLDYSLTPWDNLETTIIATPRNGYQGSVRLGVEVDNGVQCDLGQEELSFTSSAQTTLTMRAGEGASDGLRLIRVKAYDSNGRLVRTRTFSLSLSTPPKPDPLIVPHLLSSGTSYIQIGVSSLYGGALPGARVELSYLNGALMVSGTTDQDGQVKFTPSEWPLNIYLRAEANCSGYFPSSELIYTADGGVRGATISLSKGDFMLEKKRSGYAYLYPNGQYETTQRGLVEAKPAPEALGWLGGNVDLSAPVIFEEDWYGFHLSRTFVDPSSIQIVEVEGAPKRAMITTEPLVWGKAGAPTDYERNVSVGYTVQSRDYD
jgi:hypothetical protein